MGCPCLLTFHKACMSFVECCLIVCAIGERYQPISLAIAACRSNNNWHLLYGTYCAFLNVSLLSQLKGRTARMCSFGSTAYHAIAASKFYQPKMCCSAVQKTCASTAYGQNRHATELPIRSTKAGACFGEDEPSSSVLSRWLQSVRIHSAHTACSCKGSAPGSDRLAAAPPRRQPQRS
jgi:hypothetical protein